MRWIWVPLLGLAGCRAACGKQAMQTVPDAAPALIASASEAPVIVAAPRLPLSFDLKEARLLANGHVLMSIRPQRVWDWDATAPAKDPVTIDVAGEGEAEPIFVGDTAFLVERTHDSAVDLELWDVATQAKTKDLAGHWKGVQTTHSLSSDGKRFLFAACKGGETDYEYLTCDVTIYGVPSGVVLQRNQLPKLHFERYFASFPLSPSGKYFALSHNNLGVGVWDALSKKAVYGEPEHEYTTSLVWLGDDRVVVSDQYGQKIHVIALPDGTETATIDYKLDKQEFAYRPDMSPDHERIASDLKLYSGTKVAVTTVADGKTTKYAIPKSVCPTYCTHRWLDATTIEVHGEVTGPDDHPKTRIRLDATTGAQTSAAASPPPSFEKDGFAVTWSNDRADDELADAEAPANVVVTPKGKRLTFEPKPRRKDASVAGGRLLLTAPDSVRVIDADGNVAELGDPQKK